MLYALAIYQVISCSLSLLSLLYFTIVSGQLQFLGLFSYIVCALLMGLTIYVLYINAEYITNRKVTERFKSSNQWFNFVQLLQLSLLGVTFYFLSGPAIVPEFIYGDRVSGQLFVDYGFKFAFAFSRNGNDLYVGVNLIPILYLYLFHLGIRKAEADEKKYDLDLFKPKFPR